MRINRLTHREFFKPLHALLCQEGSSIYFLLKIRKTLKPVITLERRCLFDTLAAVRHCPHYTPATNQTENPIHSERCTALTFLTSYVFPQYILCQFFFGVYQCPQFSFVAQKYNEQLYITLSVCKILFKRKHLYLYYSLN